MHANRSHQVFDMPTRARFLNQRENMQLREKIKDLSFKQHSAVYRHVIDQNNLKIKLHEFAYEGGQRDLYKLLIKRSDENSSTPSMSPSEFDTIEDSSHSSMKSPSLLLHDLTASVEFEKNLHKMPIKSKKINPYDEFCYQYCSKLQTRHDLSQKPIHMSLKQYSDRLKLDIKVAIARSARNSHVITRRTQRVY